MMAFPALWARAGRVVLDALLPATCLSCEAPVGAPGQWCAACFGRLTFVTDPCCRRCGVPFASTKAGGPHLTCFACEANPPHWRSARGALVYDDGSRKLIMALKHGGRTELAARLAPHMARAGRNLLAGADLLVPVPLHRTRLIARRFSQSALLAHRVGRIAGLTVVADALARVRRTPSLGTLSARARRAVLVDDVLTSGATASACATALLAAGALEVDVLVAARVPLAHAAFV